MSHRPLPLLLALALTIAACDQPSCELAINKSKPTLDAVMARADVPRLLACAERPTVQEAAKCLGAEVLTQGLEVALERATDLAEQAREAGNPAAGAADMDAEQQAELAAELDHALDDLARELAAAHR